MRDTLCVFRQPGAHLLRRWLPIAENMCDCLAKRPMGLLPGVSSLLRQDATLLPWQEVRLARESTPQPRTPWVASQSGSWANTCVVRWRSRCREPPRLPIATTCHPSRYKEVSIGFGPSGSEELRVARRQTTTCGRRMRDAARKQLLQQGTCNCRRKQNVKRRPRPLRRVPHAICHCLGHDFVRNGRKTPEDASAEMSSAGLWPEKREGQRCAEMSGAGELSLCC